MTKLVKKIVKIGMSAMFVAVLFSVICQVNIARAASAKLVMDVSQEVFEGEEFTLDLLLDTDERIGIVNIAFSYDTSLLKFISAPAVIKASKGVITISDGGDGSTSTQRKYSIRFKALKSGICVFTYTKKPEIKTRIEDKVMSVSVDMFELEINKKEIVPMDASLSVISLAVGEMEPEFSKDIHTYKAVVPYDENGVLYLYARAANQENTDIEVFGGEKLLPGENKVTLITRTEDGNSQAYLLIVTMLEKGTELNSETSDEVLSSMPDDIVYDDEEIDKIIEQVSEKQVTATGKGVVMVSEDVFDKAKNDIGALKKELDEMRMKSAMYLIIIVILSIWSVISLIYVLRNLRK
ncbi:MAG: hypothetical protein MJ113_01325 [Lachnospiraceae bacterium]|nr:hypothetical protein [Lachnospiraceae bacterium]